MYQLKKIKNLVFYLVVVTTIASCHYYFMTRGLPTPFKDSITAVQRQLRNQTASIRKKHYANGLLLGSVIAYTLYLQEKPL